MKFLLASALLAMNAFATADTLSIDQLGGLLLRYQPVEPVSEYGTSPVRGTVAVKQGQAYTLVAPGRVEQTTYLVENGDIVQQGDAFALLRGPEMHHFIAEWEAARQVFEAAEQRYNANLELRQRKSIPEAQWISVSESFYAARLEFEHLDHFHSLVLAADEADESMLLAAPASGRIVYRDPGTGTGTGAGDVIAQFVPAAAQQLKVSLPLDAVQGLSHFQAGTCRVPVASIAAVARGLFVDVWGETPALECGLLLGQDLLVQPWYKIAAWRLPVTAVFQWQGANRVWMRRGEQLQAVTVSLLTTAGADYILQSDDLQPSDSVLITSVSALQGILLGLGGD